MKKIFKIAAVAMAVLAAGCFMSCSEEDDEKSLAEILGVEIPEAPKVTLPEAAGINELAGKSYEEEDESDGTVDRFEFKVNEVVQTVLDDDVVENSMTYRYVCDSTNKKVYAVMTSGFFTDDDGKLIKFTSYYDCIRANLPFLLGIENKDYIKKALENLKSLYELTEIDYTLDEEGNITSLDIAGDVK